MFNCTNVGCLANTNHQTTETQYQVKVQAIKLQSYNLFKEEENFKTALYCWVLGSGHWTALWLSSHKNEALDQMI